MRKQVDFVVRSWNFGNGQNGTTTSEQVSFEIRQKYLSQGYEAFAMTLANAGQFGINLIISFAKYEDVEGAKSK